MHGDIQRIDCLAVHWVPSSNKSKIIHTSYDSNGRLIFWDDLHPNDTTNKIVSHFLAAVHHTKSDIKQHDMRTVKALIYMKPTDSKEKLPWLCRWFGHKWEIVDRSSFTDWDIQRAHNSETKICRRCGKEENSSC